MLSQPCFTFETLSHTISTLKCSATSTCCTICFCLVASVASLRSSSSAALYYVPRDIRLSRVRFRTRLRTTDQRTRDHPLQVTCIYGFWLFRGCVYLLCTSVAIGENVLLGNLTFENRAAGKNMVCLMLSVAFYYRRNYALHNTLTDTPGASVYLTNVVIPALCFFYANLDNLAGFLPT